jgi:hypothetical protein
MTRVRALLGVMALCAALSTTATTVTAVHAPNIRLRAGTSTNWSGYANAGAPGSFQNVSASWTQPAVSCASQNAYSAYWVGLDGDTTNTVEQLGTEADCIGGTARYTSWYEMYPHRSFPATITVIPGHTYFASVVAQGSGQFVLTLQDTTDGTNFTTTQKLMQAKLASAEAIVEAPSGGGVLALADFGTAEFTNVTANGTTMTSPPAEQITMVNTGGTVKAQPSPLKRGTFSVTWSSAS